MTTIDEIERAVTELEPDELSRFRSWFLDFDSARWDREIESDAVSGRLDALADEALVEHRAGRTRRL